MNIHWSLSFKLPPPLHTTTHFCTFQIHWKIHTGDFCEQLILNSVKPFWQIVSLKLTPPHCQLILHSVQFVILGVQGTWYSPLPGYIIESAEATSCLPLALPWAPLVPAEVPQTGPSHWWAGFSSLMLLTHWSFDRPLLWQNITSS